MGEAPTTSTHPEPGIPARFFGDPDFDFEARLHEDEQFWPGQSQVLYRALSGEKALARFTR
ncbi:hypothetical protein [Myxococcus xanthus]|uniref:hypothetical protein n=1 Tax=Myxococcus xanthus TaxID=34 RepID=UPI00112ACEEF|nr:hypothetical protein [Myxococcus xanthus]QDE80680.1 hypothetical protein BHS07_03425 [Myxococcus xanthus]QDE94995.1 hypothetical protein BHS05_03465 [Myxococcus xanthus]QDF02263.1 hypothetical protein BHS04_03440 [Myxococcus xanthus]